MNRLTLALTVLSLVSAFAMTANARPDKRFDATTQSCRILDQGPLDWESQPWGQGGKNFRQLCQSCHGKNNDKGAPFLWVESKSSEGWNRVFTRRSVACAKDGSWDSITFDQQLMVNDYLYRFGQNSQDINDAC